MPYPAWRTVWIIFGTCREYLVWSQDPIQDREPETTSYRSIVHANREKGMKSLEMKKP
jgi:hypothetical protein